MYYLKTFDKIILIVGDDIIKIPLRFQITEFDCGTVALQNAISFLFERENIPAEVVKTIATYTLDCYDEKGNLGQGGTSIEAINLLTHWFVDYANRNDFGIYCEHLLGNDVNVDNIRKCILNKGCVLLRSYLDGEHYFVITGIDDEFVYIWDSYYLDANYHELGVQIIFDKPFEYNRKVTLNKFNIDSKSNFSLGPIAKRECVLFTK